MSIVLRSSGTTLRYRRGRARPPLVLRVGCSPREAQADPLRPRAGVDATLTGPLTEAIASELGARGYFQVLTQKELTTLLGLERQKQLLGCSDDASACLAEISGAVGARFVMNGTLARLGEAYQLTLSTLDSQKAQPLGRATRLAKQLDTLQAQLPFAIAEATATPMPPPPSRVLPYTLMGVGAGGIVFGGVGLIVTLSNEGQFASEIQIGKIASIAAASTGAVLFIVGLLVNPADLPGRGAVALVPTGSGVALVGVLP